MTVKQLERLILGGVFLIAAGLLSRWAGAETAAAPFKGQYCEGNGDEAFLRLIDDSFAFFHPNPLVPNVAMLYSPDMDTFTEGAGWGAWWIQNSYGFSYAATPFLQEPWSSMMQRSWDLFWNNQGDGKRMGLYPMDALAKLVAPDGCLGDCATPGYIAYKQGDGNVGIHDWFYEATAAGVAMQAEILLTQRDQKALARYLPKMERACDFIERARDPTNNLFLVGPACNLLAPSYGGVKQPNGAFGKGYLAGVSITYLAALDRMVELLKFAGENGKLAEYERRQRITRSSLPRLLAPGGYFVKSVEPGGLKHGVVGQAQFGYLEGTANADAVALRVADDATAQAIYRQIEAFPAIRPFDFLLVNAPGLDDTYWNYGSANMDACHVTYYRFGEWVNGGVWGTVEGRAILMYFRLGKFADAYRSAVRAMKWAKDFRMDAPWTQCGANTSNYWYDAEAFLKQTEGIAVMADNFAIPAAILRGLFDYEYRFDRLILRPRVPGPITRYVQKEPVRFGQKRIFITCINGGPNIQSAQINGKRIKVSAPDRLDLIYADLPDEARVEIETSGGWPKEQPYGPYPILPALTAAPSSNGVPAGNLPASLKEPYTALTALQQRLEKEPGQEYERALVEAALCCIEACRIRAGQDPGPGYYRAITPSRKQGIISFYEKTALNLYRSPAISAASRRSARK